MEDNGLPVDGQLKTYHLKRYKNRQRKPKLPWFIFLSSHNQYSFMASSPPPPPPQTDTCLDFITHPLKALKEAMKNVFFHDEKTRKTEATFTSIVSSNCFFVLFSSTKASSFLELQRQRYTP
ncbi:hypothetical protein Gogos_005538 [Gossypium gossypioides]|uniref:Uncharacterized protein n=1 Tax=Gossypium gossypioides TaxID=34282 RepID=A0A7J9D6T2_GOSGO|nr:hypothetical protein [Gossypium gossypioides]